MTVGSRTGTALLAIALAASVSAGCKRSRTRASPDLSRGELQVVEDREGHWLVHETLGFRLRHPGPSFVRARVAEVQARKNFSKGGEIYVFKNEEDSARLLIRVVQEQAGSDKLALEKLLADLRTEASRTSAESTEVTRFDFEEITRQPPITARVWGYFMDLPTATSMRVVRVAGSEEGYLVNLVAQGAFPEEFGPVLESLHVPPEEPPPSSSVEQLRQRYPQFRLQRAPPDKQPRPGPPPPPPTGIELVRYSGPAGKLSAYLHAPVDRKRRHPAVLWCHGGFGGVDESNWAFSERAKGEVGPLFAQHGFVVLSPAWRGESDSDGEPEIYWGEVDDALASIDYLAGLDFVDPSRIYVAGHSAGATIALFVGQRSSRIRAVFSFGGVWHAGLQGENRYSRTFPFDPSHVLAAWLRSPLAGIAETKVPTFHFEGRLSSIGDEDAAVRAALRAVVPLRVFVLDGLDHWTVVPSMARLAIEKAAADRPGASLNITDEEVAAAALAGAADAPGPPPPGAR